MPENMVNGFNINGTPVPYNYDSLGNKLEKTSIARVYDNTSTYSLDEYVIYNGILYRCISEIDTAEEWNSEHWLSTNVMMEMVYQNGVSQEIKDSLVNALSHVAWTDEHGQDYIDVLEQAMRTKLVSISAVFNPGEYDIFDDAELSDLRQFLTVSALYSDNTTRVVDNYTLSGTLAGGESVVTVSYGGKSTTFTLTTISTSLPSGYTRYDYIKRKTNSSSSVASSNFIFLNDQTDMNELSLEMMVGNNYPTQFTGAGWFGARINESGNVSCSGYFQNNTDGFLVRWRNTFIATGNLFTNSPIRFEIINPPTSPMYWRINGGDLHEQEWDGLTVINCGFVLFNNFYREMTGNLSLNPDPQIGKIVLRNYDGECVGYYQPCVYSGKIGMYDLISQTFYTAATAAAVTISNSGCLYAVGNW